MFTSAKKQVSGSALSLLQSRLDNRHLALIDAIDDFAPVVQRLVHGQGMLLEIANGAVHDCQVLLHLVLSRIVGDAGNVVGALLLRLLIVKLQVFAVLVLFVVVVAVSVVVAVVVVALLGLLGGLV